MSYDWPEGVPHPPKRRLTVRERVRNTWWAFLIWCALDCKSAAVNEWGLRKLEGK